MHALRHEVGRVSMLFEVRKSPGCSWLRLAVLRAGGQGGFKALEWRPQYGLLGLFCARDLSIHDTRSPGDRSKSRQLGSEARKLEVSERLRLLSVSWLLQYYRSK